MPQNTPLPLQPVPPNPALQHQLAGRMTFGGLPLNIETAAGQERKGVDPDGHAWAVKMPWHYGEIVGTLGLDGEPVDVMVGPDPLAPMVYVLHLRRIVKDRKTHARDEDKAYLGFRSRAAALLAFNKAYTRKDLLQGVTIWPFEDFRDWVTNPANAGRALDLLPDEAEEVLAKALGQRGIKDRPGLMLRQGEHGGPRRWQRVGEPQGEHDKRPAVPGDWGDKSRAERGRATDQGEIAVDYARAFGTLRLQGASHADLKQSLSRTLREAVQRGKLMPSHQPLAERTLGRLAGLLEQAGAAPKDAAHLLEVSMWKLLHQDLEAAKRTIGDHGLRHIARNCDVMTEIFDKLDGAAPSVGAKERLAANLAMISHDLGYTAHPISKLKVKDDYHPEAGAHVWLQEIEKDPIYNRVLGPGLARRCAGWIASHAKGMIDWTDDPVGSAVRVADNTHLFGDKLPELLFNDPEAMRTLVRLHLARGVNAGPEVISAIRNRFAQHVRERKDLPPAYQSALGEAVKELTGQSPRFLVSRLAGRDGKIEFDPNSRTLTMHIQQSPLRQMVGQVFGEDEADKQFLKMLKDFHVAPDKVKGEARLAGKHDSSVVLRWEPPGGDSHPMEATYARAAQETVDAAKKAAGENRLMEWLRDGDPPKPPGGGGAGEGPGGPRPRRPARPTRGPLGKAVEQVAGHVRTSRGVPRIVQPYTRLETRQRHPDDLSPEQVGPMRWDQDLEALERVIAVEPLEHGACFAPDGRQTGRWGPDLTREEGLDPVGSLVTEARAHLPGGTFTHNHSNGTPLSPMDLAMACLHDLAQVRAAGPTCTWICDRPLVGWPDPVDVAKAAEHAYSELVLWNSEQAESGREVTLEQRIGKYRDLIRRDPLLGPFGLCPRPTRWGADPARGRLVSPAGWGAAAESDLAELDRRPWRYGRWVEDGQRSQYRGHLIWLHADQVRALSDLSKGNKSPPWDNNREAPPTLDLSLGMNGTWNVQSMTPLDALDEHELVPVRVRFWQTDQRSLSLLNPWVKAMKKTGGFAVRGFGRAALGRDVVWLAPPPKEALGEALAKGLISMELGGPAEQVRVGAYVRGGELVAPHLRHQHKAVPGPVPTGAPHPLDRSQDIVGPVARGMDLEAVERALMGLKEEHSIVFAPDGRQVIRSGPAETRAHGDDPETCVFVGKLDHLHAVAALDGVISTHNHPIGTQKGDSPLSSGDIVLASTLNASEQRALMPNGAVCAIARPWSGWLPWDELDAALKPIELTILDLLAATGSGPPLTTVLDKRLREHDTLGPLGYRLYLTEPGRSVPHVELKGGSPYESWDEDFGAIHGPEAGWRAPPGDTENPIFPIMRTGDLLALDQEPDPGDVAQAKAALLAARGGGPAVDMPVIIVKYKPHDGSLRIDRMINRAALAAAHQLGAEIVPVSIQVRGDDGRNLIKVWTEKRQLRDAILKAGGIPTVGPQGEPAPLRFEPMTSWTGDVLRKAMMGGLAVHRGPRSTAPYGHVQVGEETLIPCDEPRSPYAGRLLRMKRTGPDDWELLEVLDNTPEPDELVREVSA